MTRTVQLLRHDAYNCPITSAWRVQLYNYGWNQACWWPIRFENFDIVVIRSLIKHLVFRLEVKWRCICLSCTDSALTSTRQAGVSKLTDAKALVDDLKQKAGEQSRQLADKQAEADAALREITASMQVGPRPSKSHRSAWEITNSNT